MRRTPAGIDDSWQVRDAAVTPATRRDNVFDPVTLERVPLERIRGGDTFSVRFGPGEGRMHLAGDDAAVAAARARRI